MCQTKEYYQPYGWRPYFYALKEAIYFTQTHTTQTGSIALTSSFKWNNTATLRGRASECVQEMYIMWRHEGTKKKKKTLINNNSRTHRRKSWTWRTDRRYSLANDKNQFLCIEIRRWKMLNFSYYDSSINGPKRLHTEAIPDRLVFSYYFFFSGSFCLQRILLLATDCRSVQKLLTFTPKSERLLLKIGKRWWCENSCAK